MLVFSFQKLGGCAYVPHVDIIRMIVRGIRRADIPVAYSQGFNPHMNLYVSPPLPLGLSTLSEFCAADTDIDPAEFLSRYNAACAPGLKAIRCERAAKNPNIAGAAAAAEYAVTGDILKFKDDILSRKQFKIMKRSKDGVETETDATEDVFARREESGALLLTLSFGNRNCRVDRLLDALCAEYGLPKGAWDAVKMQLFCKGKDGKTIPAWEYIRLNSK